jgi:hypothetical protein
MKNFPSQKITQKNIVPVTGQTIQMCTQVENESSLYEFHHLKFNQVGNGHCRLV